MFYFLAGVLAAIAATISLVGEPRELLRLGPFVIVGLAGTAIFATMTCWNLRKQGEMIWKEGVAEVISIPFSMAVFVSFFSQTAYGWHEQSLALVYSAVGRLIFYLPVIAGLWKFRRWTLEHKTMATIWGLFLISHLFVSVSNYGKLFAISLSATIGLYAHQAWAIYTEKRIGQLYPRMYWVYELSISFWLLYGLTVGDPIIIASTSVNLTINSTILVLIARYRHQGKTERGFEEAPA